MCRSKARLICSGTRESRACLRVAASAKAGGQKMELTVTEKRPGQPNGQNAAI